MFLAPFLTAILFQTYVFISVRSTFSNEGLSVIILLTIPIVSNSRAAGGDFNTTHI